MDFFFVYFGIGIAVLLVLWLLFIKTGVDRQGLRILWGRSLLGDWGFILVPLLWPIVAMLSLLWWLGDLWHLKARQKDAMKNAERLKCANKYSHLTMDELLAAQKRIEDESQNRK